MSYIPVSGVLPRETDSRLCKLCLVFEETFLRPLSSGRGGNLEPLISHQPTWRDLKQSALNGCQLCQVFRNSSLHAKRQESPSTLLETLDETDVRLELSLGARELAIWPTIKAPWTLATGTYADELEEESSYSHGILSNNFDYSSISYRTRDNHVLCPQLLLGGDEGKFPVCLKMTEKF